jgi:hypothetical protein
VTRYAPQWLQSGSYAASLDRRLIGALWPSPASSGCAVTAVGTGMDLHVDPGQVAVPSANGTGTVLCTSDAVETLSGTSGIAPAPPVGTDRVDLIVCQPRSADLDGTSTQEDFIFAVVRGADGPPPGAAPMAPAGTVELAQVHVVGGSASLAPANVYDRRPFGLAVPPTIAASCRYTLTSFTTSPTPMTVQVVPFATKVFDDLSAYNGTVWTCKKAGAYFVQAQAAFNPAAGIAVNRYIYKNGVSLVLNASQTSGWNGLNLLVLERCIVGDTIDARVAINAASQVVQAGGQSFISIGYLHP